MESVRKDVECTFGVIKTRFRYLWNGVHYHSAYTVEWAFKTACILHNLILAYDGRSLEQWEDVDWATLDPNGIEPEDEDVTPLVNADDIAEEEVEEEQDPVPTLDVPRIGRSFGVNNYFDVREALCSHFAQAFIRGNVCWPKGFQAWQKEVFVIPPAVRRARIQYNASLYHQPSTIMRVHPTTRARVAIGEGLFSRISYKDNNIIVNFVGDVISRADYEVECKDGRGGYAIHINEGLVLNCYHKFKANECLASYANSPEECYVGKTNVEAKANAKLKVNTQNRTKSRSKRVGGLFSVLIGTKLVKKIMKI